MFLTTDYKPIMFPLCSDFLERQVATMWLPHQIKQESDAKQYAILPPEEKLKLQRILEFFTQADINVQLVQAATMKMFAGRPEVIGMLSSFSTIEDVHQRAYSMKVDEFMNAAMDFYNRYKKIKVFSDRSKKAARSFDIDINHMTTELLIDHLVSHFLIGEGVFLNTFFILLLSYYKIKNILLGLDTIVTYSARDENLHVEGIQYLIKRLFELSGFTKKECLNIIARMIRDKLPSVMRDQKAILDYIFDDSEDVNGYTKEYLLRFAEWNAYRVIDVFDMIENPQQAEEGKLNDWDWMITLISNRDTDTFTAHTSAYRNASAYR